MNEKISEVYKGKLAGAEEAIGKISQGKRIFVGSFCSEPQYLVSTLLKNTDRFFDIELIRFLNIEGSLMGLGRLQEEIFGHRLSRGGRAGKSDRHRHVWRR